MSATVNAVRSTTQAVKHVLRRTNRQKPESDRSAKTGLILCGALKIAVLTGCETPSLTEAELEEPVPEIRETPPLTEAELEEPLPEIPEGTERWVCRSYMSNGTENERVVLSRVLPQDLTLGPQRTLGVVVVAGETHITMFSVQGVDRRWDWNDANDTMVIGPGGHGSYYNFRLADDEGRVKASSLFECHQR